MTWLNDHTGTSVVSHEPLQLAPKYLLKKVTTYVNLFSLMFLLRSWTFNLLQKWKSTCSFFCLDEYQRSMRGVFSWHAACSCHLNEHRLWSKYVCFELCIWDMIQRSTPLAHEWTSGTWVSSYVCQGHNETTKKEAIQASDSSWQIRFLWCQLTLQVYQRSLSLDILGYSVCLALNLTLIWKQTDHYVRHEWKNN